MKGSFKYAHLYDKFECACFSTIRGKDSIRHYKIGQVVDNIVKGKSIGKSKIRQISQQRISDIKLSILVADGQCSDDDIFIKSKRDFVELLNSFRRFRKIKDGGEVVTIFYMEWRI